MKIDLLPPEYRPQPVIQPVRLAGMIVGGILCLISLGFAAYQYRLARVADVQLQTVRQELASYQGYQQQLRRIDDLRRKVATYRLELKEFEDIYQPYLTLMKGIAAALPGSVWLEQVRINTDGVIALQGESLDFALVGSFLERLYQLDSIQSCKLQKITEVKKDKLTSYHFEIQLKTGRAQQYVSK